MNHVFDVLSRFFFALTDWTQMWPTDVTVLGLYAISVTIWVMAWWICTADDFMDPVIRVVYPKDR